MTQNSLLCQIINDHPDDWRKWMDVNYPSIRRKESTPYVIFKYSIGANFKDPVVQEARGIIINYFKKEVVCWPFRKFGNYNDSYADTIDWDSAIIQEKIDGSIIKLWYNDFFSRWVFSTDFTIYAEDALCPNVDYDGEYVTFLYAIQKCTNYSRIMTYINNDRLDKDMTYIFELTTPYNRVVIKYPHNRMYQIGARNNKTGEETHEKIFDVKPFTYTGHSLDDCLNPISNRYYRTCDFEGYVVVDKNFHRVKVKSDIYFVLHNIKDLGKNDRKRLIRLIFNQKISVVDISEQYPDIAHILKYYDYKVSEFISEATEILKVSRQIYKIHHNRKDVAIRINSHRLAFIAFAGLDNDKDFEEILRSRKGGIFAAMSKYIPKYEPTKILNDGLIEDKE